MAGKRKLTGEHPARVKRGSAITHARRSGKKKTAEEIGKEELTQAGSTVTSSGKKKTCRREGRGISGAAEGPSIRENTKEANAKRGTIGDLPACMEEELREVAIPGPVGRGNIKKRGGKKFLGSRWGGENDSTCLH